MLRKKFLFPTYRDCITIAEMRTVILTVIAVALITAVVPTTQAQESRYGGVGVQRLEYEVKATGLAPIFPERYACEPIASGWGSAQRFDGSTRLLKRNGGLHGGLDISLKEGTPLLAVAAGKVIAKGEGGALEGIYLWMLHAPEDTGLPYRAITKYQHLSELPILNVGDRVVSGQIVASSGKTGTVGTAFGPKGYAHLHLSLFVTPVNETPLQDESISPVPPKDGKLSDPMLLFLSAGAEYEKANEFSEAAKRVPVGAADRNGGIQPSGSKVVWPVYCSEKTR